MKRIITLLVLMILSSFLCMGCGYSHEEEIHAPKISSEYLNQYYKQAEIEFREAGFDNVKSEPAGDLKDYSSNLKDTVIDISVDGNKKYTKDDWFQKDDEVIIRYHSVWSRAYQMK